MRRENKRMLGYVLSMEDKMAAGAFGRARNYGCDVSSEFPGFFVSFSIVFCSSFK